MRQAVHIASQPLQASVGASQTTQAGIVLYFYPLALARRRRVGLVAAPTNLRAAARSAILRARSAAYSASRPSRTIAHWYRL